MLGATYLHDRGYIKDYMCVYIYIYMHMYTLLFTVFLLQSRCTDQRWPAEEETPEVDHAWMYIYIYIYIYVDI